VPGLLAHADLVEGFGDRIRAAFAHRGRAVDLLLLPPAPDERLDDDALAAVELACFTGEWRTDPVFTRRFFGALLRAPNLRWVHLPNAGVDDPVFARLLARGVRLTTSSAAKGEPIAQSAIAGLLAIARGFPAWSDAQRRREWRPHEPAPPDLRGQAMVVVGVGSIGGAVARIARAIGLRVVGVRRSPRRADDPVDEIVPPARLGEVAAAADWLVLACPLVAETRGLVDAALLGRLPRGAGLVNVARGAVVDEPALVAALRSGHLRGAYLDVFAEEPLPARSPLWELPGVIVTPHDAGASAGNAGRVAGLFLDNLDRWLSGAPLVGEVASGDGAG